jgi:hypothetical protein
VKHPSSWLGLANLLQLLASLVSELYLFVHREHIIITLRCSCLEDATDNLSRLLGTWNLNAKIQWRVQQLITFLSLFLFC